MIFTRITHGFVLLSAIGCVVGAQAADTTTKASTMRIRVGGGTLWGDGGVGLAGLDWQPAHSRFGIRATSEFSQRTIHQADLPPFTLLPADALRCATQCVDRLRNNLVGVSLDAKYNLLTGAFRPYVFSGVGLYRSVETEFLYPDCSTNRVSCSFPPGRPLKFTQAATVQSMQGGFGATMRLKGQFELYGEASWRALNGAESSPNPSWKGPTTVGFRF